MPSNVPRRVTIFTKGHRTGGKVIAVPDTFEELLLKAKNKLGLHGNAVVAVYNKSGGLLEDVELIRDDEVLYVSSEDPTTVNGNVHEAVNGVKSFTDWVTLNVGGQIFTTTRATLMNEPNSMLAKMFSPAESWSSITDSTGAFLFDRSPVYFEPILNYLRHGQLILDNGANPQGVLEEAKFFGISGILEQLEEMAKGINLDSADLSKLDLRFINFKMANLKKTDLANANLSNCCLERANLSGAHMDGAILSCTRLQRAHMEGASLRGCNFEDPAGTRAHLEGVNLKGSDLEGSQLGNVNLRVATLKGANLQNCNLRGAELAGADLENCNLTGCDLQDANLRGANITGATIADITGPLHMTAFVRNQLPGSRLISSPPDS
ncbi:BTB/POZ domain-containing protein KCTD9-like isoform X2 [Porites lutea]|uniref:BTB/POZ domain-containing protein KCTD9-like isoform X2 n=1 Tax=Porites lutea TaxID=51062 RepID=UPI003CC64C2F